MTAGPTLGEPGALIWTVARPGNDRAMTVVKINAITVREGSGDELARRFAKRAGAVDDADGFEGFELLQPNDEPGGLAGAHPVAGRGVLQRLGGIPRLRPRPPRRDGPGPRPARPVAPGRHAEPPPVGAHSELWSYDIVDLPSPR